jgi:hypothetical protein
MDRREAARWRLSNKALDRIAEYGFDEVDVYAAVLSPHTTNPGHTPGTVVRTRGNVSAVVDPETYVVITVMGAYGARPPLNQRAVYPDRVLTPVPPAPPAKTAPKPVVTEDEPYVHDVREIKNMAARIRLLSATHAEEVPDCPKYWLGSVCLPRMRDYPGRWARLVVAPYASVAQALAEQIGKQCQVHGDEVEIVVRGPHIYGRSL